MFNWMQLQVNDNSAGDGPSSSTNAGDIAEDDDGDELDMDELNAGARHSYLILRVTI